MATIPHLELMANTIRARLGTHYRGESGMVLDQLPGLLHDDEELLVFVQGRLDVKGKPRGLAVGTDERILFAVPTGVLVEAEWDDVKGCDGESDWLRGGTFHVETVAGRWSFREPTPLDELVRLEMLIGDDFDEKDETVDLPKSPRHPPVGAFADALLYDDRLIDVKHNAGWPLTTAVTAKVETAGNLSITEKDRLIGWGERIVTADVRELYVSIDGPDWYYLIPVNPQFGAQARAFTQLVNLMARSSGQPASSSPSEPAGDEPERKRDRLDRLTQLADLRRDGVLTDEEFQAEKARILAED